MRAFIVEFGWIPWILFVMFIVYRKRRSDTAIHAPLSSYADYTAYVLSSLSLSTFAVAYLGERYTPVDDTFVLIVSFMFTMGTIIGALALCDLLRKKD